MVILLYLIVEYRIDLFAIFILLGIVQAIFLSFFFFGKNNRKIPTNRYQGLFLLSIAAVTLEIFLMYTGYIVDVLHLVDFSEPIAFLIGPFVLFTVNSALFGQPGKHKWVHYIFPALYLCYGMFLFLQPVDMKYNGYLEAYHPDWPKRSVEMAFSDDPWGLRHWHSELVMLSTLVYAVLSTSALFRYLKTSGNSLWRIKDMLIVRSRNLIIITFAMFLVIFIVKALYPRDFGDHFISSFVTIIIYASSFEVIRTSPFFRASAQQKKYDRSSLSQVRKEEALEKIRQSLEENGSYLRIGYGLSDLAKEIGLSTHHASEVINDGLGKSFFDLIGEYRVNEAIRIMSSTEGAALKLEEIAERVGYSSKSSFNTQFKKVTGQTPSEFR